MRWVPCKQAPHLFHAMSLWNTVLYIDVCLLNDSSLTKAVSIGFLRGLSYFPPQTILYSRARLTSIIHDSYLWTQNCPCFPSAHISASSPSLADMWHSHSQPYLTSFPFKPSAFYPPPAWFPNSPAPSVPLQCGTFIHTCHLSGITARKKTSLGV